MISETMGPTQLRARGEGSTGLAGARRPDEPVIIRRPEPGTITRPHVSGSSTVLISANGGRHVNAPPNFGGLMLVLSDEHFSITYRDGSGPNGAVTREGSAAALPRSLPFTLDYTSPVYLTWMDHSVALSPGLFTPIVFSKDEIAVHLDAELSHVLVRSSIPGRHASDGWKLSGAEQSGRSFTVVGTSNQEFHVENSLSLDGKRFHYRTEATTTYITFGGMTLLHGTLNGSEIEPPSLVTLDPGDVAIVPNGVPHLSKTHGEAPTYVSLSSAKPIKDDVVAVPAGDIETAMLDSHRSRHLGEVARH